VIDAVPAATAVTIPGVPTTATDELLVVQVPPLGVEDNVDVAPGQSNAVPLKAVGTTLTLRTREAVELPHVPVVV
jgi:hypothetical protein